MEYPKFKVCCRCFTFNQAKYITDAMNGFTMQQTSFPFVCCIVDDASTDGEKEVIRKYVEDNFDLSEGSVAYHKETDNAHITYAQHKANKNCYFAVLYLKENHYSQRKPKMPYLTEWRDLCEYEALCEGDDYWIIGEKLQLQVSYLDNNQSASLCFDPSWINIKGEIKQNNFVKHHLGKSSINDLCFGNYISTCSVVYRRNECLSELMSRVILPSKIGDYPQFMYLASWGYLYSFPMAMSVYRIHSDNSWRGTTTVVDKSFDIIGYLYNILHSGAVNGFANAVIKLRILESQALLYFYLLKHNKTKAYSEKLNGYCIKKSILYHFMRLLYSKIMLSTMRVYSHIIK